MFLKEKIIGQKKEELPKTQRVNLSQLTVEDITGKEVNLDMHTEIANLIYQKTSDISWMEKARALFRDGYIDLTEGDCARLSQILDENQVVGFIKVAIKKLLVWNLS